MPDTPDTHPRYVLIVHPDDLTPAQLADLETRWGASIVTNPHTPRDLAILVDPASAWAGPDMLTTFRFGRGGL